MADPYISIPVAIGFWSCASIDLCVRRRSWFPFTILAPALLLGVAACIDHFAYRWGTVFIVSVHALLLGLLIYFILTDAPAPEDGESNEQGASNHADKKS